ncbi:MAG: cation transporter dimerization domain-containing protein, partial [Candidatus Jordarchaeaceae archaeon]
HDISLAIEKRVKEVFPNSDIVVHTEPTELRGEPITQKIRNLALINEFQVHDVHIHEVKKKKYIDLHLEVPPKLSLEETHKLAHNLENEIRNRIADVEEVNIHLETVDKTPVEYVDVTEESKKMGVEIKEVVESVIGSGRCHKVRIRKVKNKFHVYLHCVLDENMPIKEVHTLTSKIEFKIKKKIPQVDEVNIHAEPPSEG